MDSYSYLVHPPQPLITHLYLRFIVSKQILHIILNYLRHTHLWWHVEPLTLHRDYVGKGEGGVIF